MPGLRRGLPRNLPARVASGIRRLLAGLSSAPPCFPVESDRERVGPVSWLAGAYFPRLPILLGTVASSGFRLLTVARAASVFHRTSRGSNPLGLTFQRAEETLDPKGEQCQEPRRDFVRYPDRSVARPCEGCQTRFCSKLWDEDQSAGVEVCGSRESLDS